MMRTPINDFLEEYKIKNCVRFHMPGHKGRGTDKLCSVSPYDITEITGADFLFSESEYGIIYESEKNASELYNSALSLYSTEGSSLAVKAMLFIAYKGNKNRKILAARNVHKSFINACALIDLDIDWIYPKEEISSICAMKLTASDLEEALSSYDSVDMPSAVYVTSPDYQGNMLDIKGLAEVCKRYGAALLVDNAHGAYLNFLTENIHPLALGADMCCDSAHKTLPCLTGGAYLHISKNADKRFHNRALAKQAMQLFATTSPSYLILQSLDLCNRTLSDKTYIDKLNKTCEKVKRLKEKIRALGFGVLNHKNCEPLKLVILCENSGVSGKTLLSELEKRNIYCEHADDSSLIIMISPENNDSDFNILLTALENIKSNFEKTENTSSDAFTLEKLMLIKAEKAMSVREAFFSESETVSITNALGRVCSTPVSVCPPCIPLVISGEVFSRDILNLLRRYSIFSVNVVQ